jgi:hypothetical protein
MKRIDFSQPNGFPLEADATLGFMQSDYQDAIKGMAGFFGDNTIVSGLQITGGSVSEGWILVDGELIFFPAGTYQPTFYIKQDVVSKANQNGALIDRYFTKTARWGTSSLYPQYSFAQLQRLQDYQRFQRAFSGIIGIESTVIISGCEVTVTGGDVAITAGMLYVNGEVFLSPALASPAFPVYLKQEGSNMNWVSVEPVSGVFVAFDPYTSQHYKDVLSRHTALVDEIRTVVALSDRFDNTGLGKWNMLGWAVCNGANGTTNMQGRSLFGLSETDADFADSVEGGGKNAELTLANMPSHNHHSTNTEGAVSPGEYGLIRKSTVGQSVTIANSVDAQDSGHEPDLRASPYKNYLQGNNQPFSVLPPYKVVLFIQRVL